MKRIILFVALLTTGFLSAATRSMDDALEIARCAASQQAPAARMISRDNCEVLRSTDAYYAVRAGSCFVVVAADEDQPEVLGFSSNGAFENDQFPPALEAWLAQYNQAPAYREAVSDEKAPIVPSHWDQGTPYNNMVPTISGSHCVAGCTAIAMSQLMYTHKYPTEGVGSTSYTWNGKTLSANFGNTTYEWNNMLPSYDGNYTQAQANAVATLVYHCGVAINIDYDLGGSSGIDVGALTGLFTYFNYDENIRLLPKSFHTIDYIAEELRKELRAGRPIYVSGQGAGGGHAFLCDGFTANGYFHFNWGWGGLGDGDYLLTGLNPTQQGAGANQLGDYNSDVTFATGIRPSTGSSSTPLCQLSVGNVLMGATSVTLGQGTTVQLQTVRNYGLHTFSGTYSVGLLDANGTLVRELANPFSAGSLDPGYYFTTPLSCNITFPSQLSAGTYYLCGLYRSNGETEAHIMAEYGGAHAARVKVSGNTVASDPIENESPVELAVDSVSCNVKQVARNGSIQLTAHRVMNIGNESFSGTIGVVLLSATSGEIQNVLVELSQLLSLPSNYYFTSPISLPFSIPSSVADGEYYLTFAHHQVSCKWKPMRLFSGSKGKLLVKASIHGNQITLAPEASPLANEMVYISDETEEVYTLTGLRIPKEQMVPSQVYIIRQGGKTKKVMY